MILSTQDLTYERLAVTSLKFYYKHNFKSIYIHVIPIWQSVCRVQECRVNVPMLYAYTPASFNTYHIKSFIPVCNKTEFKVKEKRNMRYYIWIKCCEQFYPGFQKLASFSACREIYYSIMFQLNSCERNAKMSILFWIDRIIMPWSWW